MKITNISVVLHDRRAGTLKPFGIRDGKMPMGVLRIETDEGVEGVNFISSPGPGPDAVAQQIVTFLKPLLVGEDPLDIGRHAMRLARMNRFVDPIAIGVVDVALWDIAGKVAGMPIHRLLGTYRDEVPAYFSSGHHDAIEDYAEEALYWRDQGWKGYKLHPPTATWDASRKGKIPVEDDITASTAVREAVGDEMELLLDSSWGYTYPEALRVGRAIEELRYQWYEDPLGAEDIYGYQKLKQYLEIPILATEATLGGLATLPKWIEAKATDALRGDVVIKGGITGMMKISHLAEAFAMNCEVHFAYNALNNVASLHVIMAIPNCDWFEVISFDPAGQHTLDHLSYGLDRPIEIDGEGFVHAPTEPGLGFGVDWELIESAPLGRIE
jgi:L-alanine-DL-glutamate epimerase-like enolase superfamily enzyme